VPLMRLTPALTRNGLIFGFVILAIVLSGFWRTYFSNPFVPLDVYRHMHGFGMTLWCLMLIAQAFLFRAKRLDIHRLIGKAAFVIVPVNVVLMLVVVQIRMPTIPESFADGVLTDAGHFFVAASWVDAGLYGVFFALAMLNRRNPAVHARYMLCTPLPVIAAATDRIFRNYFGEFAAWWTGTVGAIHLETFTWLSVDSGLLALALVEWRLRQPVNVFGRALLILVAFQALAIYWHRIAPLRAFGEWFVGI